MRQRTLIDILNRFSLVVLFLAVAASVLVALGGTLLIDDPHAEFRSFVASALMPLLPMAGITALCQVLSRTAWRWHSVYLAAFVAVFPALAIVALGIYAIE